MITAGDGLKVEFIENDQNQFASGQTCVTPGNCGARADNR